MKKRHVKVSKKISAAAVATASNEEIEEYKLPSWAMFELGRAAINWKTMNGLPPISEVLTSQSCVVVSRGLCSEKIEAKLILQYTQFKFAFLSMNLIFSFTNGVDWDGPYRLQFQVPKALQSKPTDFFNEGLAEELSKEGACQKAIFPDTNIAITRCAIIGNLSKEGGDRYNLDLVPGCTDLSSPLYNPLANVDDGSYPIDLDSESEE